MKLVSYVFFGGLAIIAACSADRTISGLVPADAADAAPTVSRGVTSGPGAISRSVYPFAPSSITGQPVNLSQYRGRKILIVNTASHCGFTPQYAQLEQLWQQYGNRVVVLGFPCNQFGGQEPGNDSTINAFCTQSYGVTFPMFSRINVNAPSAAPLYQFLTDRTRNGYTNERPSWNFCKYLIDENGKLIGYYPSAVAPMSPTLISAILR